MAVLSRLDVDMCNVHAAGTIEMMKAALEGLTRADGTRPLLIADLQEEEVEALLERRERVHHQRPAPATHVQAAQGLQAAIDGTDDQPGIGYPCVVNDEHLVKQAAALAREEKLQVEMLPLRTTAEDFGFYCTKYPSLFYRLGVGAAAGRPHTATFNPDEGAINVGIGFMKRLALQILKK